MPSSIPLRGLNLRVCVCLSKLLLNVIIMSHLGGSARPRVAIFSHFLLRPPSVPSPQSLVVVISINTMRPMRRSARCGLSRNACHLVSVDLVTTDSRGPAIVAQSGRWPSEWAERQKKEPSSLSAGEKWPIIPLNRCRPMAGIQSLWFASDAKRPGRKLASRWLMGQKCPPEWMNVLLSDPAHVLLRELHRLQAHRLFSSKELTPYFRRW